MKDPPSKRAQATRDALFDSAAEVLSTNPRASLADIAKAAGVGRATLHRYFASRTALVVELAQASIRAIDEACAGIDYYGQSATRSLRETLEAIVPLGARYSFLAFQGEVLEDPSVAAALERQLAQTRELVDAVKAEGGFGHDVPSAWIVAAIDSLIYAAWLELRRGTIAPREVGELIFRTLTAGLGPRGS